MFGLRTETSKTCFNLKQNKEKETKERIKAEKDLRNLFHDVNAHIFTCFCAGFQLSSFKSNHAGCSLMKATKESKVSAA